MDSDASEVHMAQDEISEKTLKNKKAVHTIVSDSFTTLLRSSAQDRLKAATTLVQYLLSKQVNQNGELCHELTHVLRRLVRGVGTPREDARIGFYATLVSLLATFPQITITVILEVIQKEQVGGGAVTKREHAEVFTGQVLTYGAVIQSGKLKSASPDDQQTVLTNLIAAASKRDFLRAHAYSFLIQFIESVPKEVLKSVVLPVITPHIALPWPQQTHNTLHALLSVTMLHPKVFNARFYAKHLEDDFACASSLRHCCQMLMTPPKHTFLEHPVYETFCIHLVSTNQVESFFGDVLESFLAKRAAHGSADMAAAKMLLYTASHIKDKTQVSCLLSGQMLQLVMRYGRRKGKQRDLISEALAAGLDAIVATLKGADEDAIVDVIQRLLYVPENQHNELGSGYHVVKQLLPLLGEPGVSRLLLVHRGIMESEPAAKPGAAVKRGQVAAREKDRVLAVQAYANLLAHPALQQDQKHRAELTKPLIEMGFTSAPSVSQLSITQARAAFFKTLDQRAPNLNALREYLSALVELVHDAVFAPKAKPRQPPTVEVSKAWSRMRKAATSLAGKSKVAAAPLFHTMFLHLGLLLLSDERTATEGLQELHSCLDRAVKGSAPAASKRRLSEGTLEAGEPEWAEVAVELLLSLLSHPAHLLRGLVLCVFPHLLPHLTPSALHQILGVLDVSSEQSLLRDEDDSDSESDEEGDEEEEEEDEEEEEEEDDEDEEVEDDGNEEPVNEQLKMALQKALWGTGDVPDSEDENIEPDEEEGAKLNAALASAFSQFKGSRPGGRKKTKQSLEDEALMHFRSRVLDVLEVVLAAQPPMASCLEAVPPLLRLLQSCIQDPLQKALENRVRVCLGKLSAVRSWRDTEDVTPERLTTLLDSVLGKGERSAPLYLDMLPDTTAVATFILRCSHRLGDNNGTETGVTKRFLLALEEFMTCRDCLHNVTLYINALALPWTGNFALAESLVHYAFAPIRDYRREQALGLLLNFVRNKALTTGTDNEQRSAEIMDKVLKSSIKLFVDNASAREAPLKPNYMLGLSNLLRFMLNKTGAQHKRRWSKLGAALVAFLHAGRVKGSALGSLRTLANRLGLQLDKEKIRAAVVSQSAPKAINGNAAKGESDEEDDDDEGQGGRVENKQKKDVMTNGTSHSEDESDVVKKAAKRKRKEEKKLKHKQAKEEREEPGVDVREKKLSKKKAGQQFRMDAMSEGFVENVFKVGMKFNAEPEESTVKVNGETKTKKKKNKKSKKRVHKSEDETREPKKKKSKNKT